MDECGLIARQRANVRTQASTFVQRYNIQDDSETNSSCISKRKKMLRFPNNNKLELKDTFFFSFSVI